MSVFIDAGLLILGSRMKRISERFLSELSKVYKEQKIQFEPAWFPIIYMLDKKGPLSLTEIANELEVSHSAISQMITQLQDKKIVEIVPNETDARVKRIFFTSKGQKLLKQVHSVWKALIQTLDHILPKEEQTLFLRSLSNLEEKIASGFMANHTLELLLASPIDIVCSEADQKHIDKVIKWAKGEGFNFVPGENRVLVATSHNDIVGFASYTCDNEKVNLQYIFVSPDIRRQGIGTKLMESLNKSYLDKTNGYFKLRKPGIDLIKLLIKANYSFKVN
jgi:DNA-binding MarR family transcriptional regulator/GNAT superfamily N-acetyltransferase